MMAVGGKRFPGLDEVVAVGSCVGNPSWPFRQKTESSRPLWISVHNFSMFIITITITINIIIILIIVKFLVGLGGVGVDERVMGGEDQFS